MTLPTRSFVLLFSIAGLALAGAAPEIDPGTGGSAIAVLGAAILILRSRTGKRKG